MQALKVIIPGDYWDVQIYRGRLHLWTMSGDITTIHWDCLIDQLAEIAVSALAVRLGLAQGAALYGKATLPLRAEPEFRDWLLARFQSQASQPMTVSPSQLTASTLGQQPNPISDLPTDTEVYRRMLYAATNAGIWEASVGKTKYPISTRPRKLADLPAVSLRAYSRQLALAATGDGLFQLGIDKYEDTKYDLNNLSERHCEKVDWAFRSVFATSTLSGGYLFSRYWQTISRNITGIIGDYSIEDPVLIDGGIFDDTSIDGSLSQPDVSWARSNRIHTAQMHRLTSSRYVQMHVPDGIDKASASLGEIVLDNEGRHPISGGSATFGTIVECDDRLIVVLSDESQVTIRGPITRWRTFPRSVNYENHLHIIFDDYIVIYAFYSDYFVDQRKKRFGIEYREDVPRH